MKPIRKMRLFRSRTDGRLPAGGDCPTIAAGRGKAVLTGVVYGDGAPLAGVCVSDGVQFATTDAAGRYRIESDKSAGFVFAVTPSNWVAPRPGGVSRFSGRRSTRRMPVTNSTTSILQASISRATR